MDRWLGKTALVTGAATGIGEAITRALLRNGVNVVAVDIQEEKLADLHAHKSSQRNLGVLHTRHCDISNEQDIERVFKHIEETYDGVDIMVNNAGVSNYNRVIESDRKTFERLLNINVLAVATCVNMAVRSMRARNVEGHVFNVNSVLGHEIPAKPLSEIIGCNGWNLYPACKHATVALTHTVRRELAAIKSPIRITSISPGIVKTEIAKHSAELQELLDEVPALVPNDVADALIYALATRPEVQITELTIQHTGEF
ncbi:farnesol dehydrogenase isoform X1 [Harpegnathos saltator]|uniref:farnesol dehydrogenase isoform X1 n=1 Tax=Harpegnathos saltator TaxID=610380 RepID=UPI000590C599|nr:farnesol dehydrogenase isoform X1 [Harpegnathos saltator]